MFKLMYVHKELRHLNYKELVNRQVETLAKVEEAIKEAQQVKVENAKIQHDLLMVLGSLNDCSKDDLLEMQNVALNYMKIAINKERGGLNG